MSMCFSQGPRSLCSSGFQNSSSKGAASSAKGAHGPRVSSRAGAGRTEVWRKLGENQGGDVSRAGRSSGPAPGGERSLCPGTPRPWNALPFLTGPREAVMSSQSGVSRPRSGKGGLTGLGGRTRAASRQEVGVSCVGPACLLRGPSPAKPPSWGPSQPVPWSTPGKGTL